MRGLRTPPYADGFIGLLHVRWKGLHVDVSLLSASKLQTILSFSRSPSQMHLDFLLSYPDIPVGNI